MQFISTSGVAYSKNSTVSIDSEHQNGLSSSTDYVLITGRLEKIPVEPSRRTLKHFPKRDLTLLVLSHAHLGESTQQSLFNWKSLQVAVILFRVARYGKD